MSLFRNPVQAFSSSVDHEELLTYTSTVLAGKMEAGTSPCYCRESKWPDYAQTFHTLIDTLLTESMI